MTWEVIHGDCRDVIGDVRADATVCDPPYGCGNNGAYTRLTGLAPGNDFTPLRNDFEPFDPSHLLAFPKAVIWGYQFMAQYLPPGTILVWQKKADYALGTFLSDGELAWQKGGKGVYIYEHRWNGFLRQTERGDATLHPTQKPVALMRWCLERLKLPPGATVFDGYAGSGPVGVACMEMGYNYIGVEIDEGYCEISRRRIAAAAQQTNLFEETTHGPAESI